MTFRINSKKYRIPWGDSHEQVDCRFFGTFWLVRGGCGSAVLAAAFPAVGIGLSGVSLAFGLTVWLQHDVGDDHRGRHDPDVPGGDSWRDGLTCSSRIRTDCPWPVTDAHSPDQHSGHRYLGKCCAQHRRRNFCRWVCVIATVAVLGCADCRWCARYNGPSLVRWREAIVRR